MELSSLGIYTKWKKNYVIAWINSFKNDFGTQFKNTLYVLVYSCLTQPLVAE